MQTEATVKNKMKDEIPLDGERMQFCGSRASVASQPPPTRLLRDVPREVLSKVLML